jgi:hypothetical protein
LLKQLLFHHKKQSKSTDGVDFQTPLMASIIFLVNQLKTTEKRLRLPIAFVAG